jgi:transcriptional regulator with XRE-family HTH domain
MAGFASEVKHFMGDRDMSLRALAKASGYDASYLSKVLNGKKPYSAYMAKRIDDALGAEGKIRAAAHPDLSPGLMADAGGRAGAV